MMRMQKRGWRFMSAFAREVPMAPADPILSLKALIREDTSPRLVDVGVGAYRDDAGRSVVLPSVLEARRRIECAIERRGLEYAPIQGDPQFLDVATTLAYGKDSAAIAQKRLAAVQSLSGTGALRLGFELLRRFRGDAAVYFSQPTWANHVNIARDAGFGPSAVCEYKYVDLKRLTFEFEAMCSSIMAAPNGSVFFLHACAHNPTGMDPTQAQWRMLSSLFKAKQHVPFFDLAYQGFASGDVDRDAFAVRQFVADGHNVLLAQSFAKNFGLYGERVGTFSVVADSEDEAARIGSQLRRIIRAMYSSPPVSGARVVTTVLSDAALAEQWRSECASMAGRISRMRLSLRGHLARETQGIGCDWSHLTQQVGMFGFLGLDERCVDALRKAHIYMQRDGRISLCGVNDSNVAYLARKIAQARRGAHA